MSARRPDRRWPLRRRAGERALRNSSVNYRGRGGNACVRERCAIYRLSLCRGGCERSRWYQVVASERASERVRLLARSRCSANCHEVFCDCYKKETGCALASIVQAVSKGQRAGVQITAGLNPSRDHLISPTRGVRDRVKNHTSRGFLTGRGEGRGNSQNSMCTRLGCYFGQ